MMENLILPGFCHLMRFAAAVPDEIVVAREPLGAKLSICYFAGGDFQGQRLRGTVVPGGGDWASNRNSDSLVIEVRGVLRTDDGATIFLRYDGLWCAAPGKMDKVLAAGGMAHYETKDHYLRVFARFETAHTRYLWLNNILALGLGALTHTGVAFQFFEIL